MRIFRFSSKVRSGLPTALATHPARVVVGLLVLCFVCEFAIMGAFSLFSIDTSGLAGYLLDACLLTALVAPALWFFVVRPIQRLAIGEKARAQQVVSQSLDAIITAGEDGLIESLNPAGEKLFGYESSEVVGKSLVTLMPASYRDRHEKGMRRYVTTGERGLIGGPAIRMEALRKDGQVVPVELSINEMRDGRKRGFVGIVRDITERKRAEDEVELLRKIAIGVSESESLDEALRFVLEAMCRAAKWEYGEAWIVRPREESIAFQTSWATERLRSGKVALTAPGFAFPKGRGLAGRAWAENRVLWVSDLLGDATFVRTEQARELGLRWAVAIPVLDHREVIGVLVFFNSVVGSDDRRMLPVLSAVAGQVGGRILRKQAEQWVSALSGIMAQVADPILITDKQGRIEYVNPAFEVLTGWHGEEIMGLTPRVLKSGFHGVDFHARLWQTLQAGEVFRAEFQNVKRTGELFYYEQTITPIMDATGAITGYVGTGKDVTDRHRMEKERIKTAKLESVGVLAGGIAHDFNNILTAVIGNISFAKREAAEGTEARSALADAEAAARRAKTLTQQLLTFARGGAPVREPLDVAEVVRSSAEFAASGSAAKCGVEAKEDLCLVEADPSQIGQVVQNLVVNAIQAMAPGGTVTLRLRNHEQAQAGGHPLEPGRYVRIDVVDTGCGIEKANVSKVFDPYFSTKPTGSGLGLAVCHSIVKNHGGHIEIESEVGKGTTVSVYLPATGKARGAAEVQTQETTLGKGRILVMDDEEAVRSVAARMLKSLGYEVETAAEGMQAVDLYARRRSGGGGFDAVLMDLTVPGGMGGKEAVKEVLKMDPSARVLVSSGYSDDPILANFKEYGFWGRIPKPYSVEDLGRALSEVLGTEHESASQ